MKIAIEPLNRDFWKCDPETHKLEKTYRDIKALHKILINNEDLTKSNNGIYDGNAITEKCYQKACADDLEKCSGGVVSDCREFGKNFGVCLQDSGKKYNFVYNKDSTIRYGNQNGNCEMSEKSLSAKQNSKYYLCTCSNSYGTQKINLNAAVSDIALNKVIIGVRLVLERNIYSIQIQQGRLSQYGDIDDSSIEWKNIEYLTYDYSNPDNYHTYSITPNKEIVYLDDFVAPKGTVLTGLKFALSNSHPDVEGSLQLLVRTNPFNFTSGLLNLTETAWSDYVYNTASRSEYEISKKTLPSSTNVPSNIQHTANQFIKFQVSDIKEDIGQNTIPYLDVQDVETRFHVPLSGAGLYYKGGQSAGFLGLKLFTYDYAPYIPV